MHTHGCCGALSPNYCNPLLKTNMFGIKLDPEWYNKQCVKKASLVTQEQLQKCQELCPFPCEETKYEVKSDAFPWPTEGLSDIADVVSVMY